MLGEQLIKNERIALIELIKNGYDADADWVKISFINFSDEFEIKPESKIIIEDSGCGMTEDVIKNHWVNPATPIKRYRRENREFTPKGRVIQGEKGIGRFAVLKLGRKVKMITRSESEDMEHVVNFDFSKYDDEFLTENGEEKNIFLDQIEVSMETRFPKTIKSGEISIGIRKLVTPSHGTYIEITDLKGSWSQSKVEKVFNDITRFQSIFSLPNGVSQMNQIKPEFDVWIFRNDKLQNFREEYIEKLNDLLQERSVIKIENGLFDQEKLQFVYCENGDNKSISIRHKDITGIKVFKDHFGNAGNKLDDRKINCGSFQFGFYIFDFSTQAPLKYKLDNKDKVIIKAHRIYLYRDGIRVYPYGEPEDDWLRIDAYRGTISAGHFLSNDQVVGYINITQKENPKLKDKTNREGLIDEGFATEDFVVLIQTFLSYMRRGPYARYRSDIESKNNQDVHNLDQVQLEFQKLKEISKNDKNVFEAILNTERKYKAEHSYLLRRAEITEELAGVGLSIESASHDIMLIMSKTLSNIDELITEIIQPGEIDKKKLLNEINALRGSLSFIESQLKDVQLLFTSSKQRRRNLLVKDLVYKVSRIYKNILKKSSIILEIYPVGSPLKAKSTDAVLLQLLLNLFDNSIYWLNEINILDRKIEIWLDGNKQQMIFSDNGPGISKEDIPYIFEPFYSGKGEEGRGLGLYIARQLLERQGFSINLAEINSEKRLSGANFVVSFIMEDE